MAVATGNVGTTAGTGEPDSTPRSRPPEDLTSDPLLAQAPRIEYRGAKRPALGGIPLLAKLGQGGMGAVYLGFHTSLDAEVAVKVLPLHLVSQNPDITQRFIREAQIAGSINSANLIYVRNVGKDAGYFYQVMEYVHGVSAGSYLKHFIAKTGRKGLPETEALEICLAAAKGLAAAHARNIIHRDIKPDNILIPRARNRAKLLFSDAKVADLGLARTERAEHATDVYVPQAGAREGPSLTGAGQAMGTLGYMPSEQIDDARSAGKPADVFALGATLYALLAGHAPFEGQSSMERRLETVQGRKKPLAQERPDVSPATVLFIESCLQMEPARRYPDAAVLVAALQKCLAPLKIEAAPTEALILQPVSQQAETQPSTFLPHEPPVLTAASRQAPAGVPASGSYRGPIAAGVALLLLAVGGTLLSRWQQARADRDARAAEAARIAVQKAEADEARDAEQKRKADEAARKATVARWAAEAARKAAMKKVEQEAEAARVAARKKAEREAESARVAAENEAQEREAEAARTKKIAEDRARPWDGKETVAAYAKRTELPETQTLDLGRGVKLELVLIPAGKFMMGSPETEKSRKPDEGPLHEVTISKPFYMGKHELTQEQYEAVAGTNPSEFKGAKNPVENVSWNDAQEFCKKATEAHRRGAENAEKKWTVRLPTEAEWEYACRAGTTTRFSFGDSQDELWQYGNYCDRSNKSAIPWQDKQHDDGHDKTSPVGSLKPNAWGLYDMHGNVWEWCEDWHGEYAAGAAMAPKGAAIGAGRVMRGGSWHDDSKDCRAAYRERLYPGGLSTNRGFRVAAEVPSVAPAPDAPAARTAPTPDGAATTSATSQKPEAKAWPLWDGKETIGAYAKRANLPATQSLDLGNGVTLELVLIPAGKFMMGSPATERDREADEMQYEVTITKPFYIGKYEVTGEQYVAVTGRHGGLTAGTKGPMESVSWNRAHEFCKKATDVAQHNPLRYMVRLPTEAEWEYACRAGTATRFSSGDIDGSLANVAWCLANSQLEMHPVGQRKPNAWGLYDMHGNVWEWCQDWYAQYAAGAVTDPQGPAIGDNRVLRGGCYNDGPGDCRSAHRHSYSPGQLHTNYGFRVVVDVPTAFKNAPAPSYQIEFVVSHEGIRGHGATAPLVEQANAKYEEGMKLYRASGAGTAAVNTETLKSAMAALQAAVKLYDEALKKEPGNKALLDRQTEANMIIYACRKYLEGAR